uniref:Uncharacterized protein n=1 Tax=Arundo donax TaxID=35708 RepID=A0A0A9FI44_ARUDO
MCSSRPPHQADISNPAFCIDMSSA